MMQDDALKGSSTESLSIDNRYQYHLPNLAISQTPDDTQQQQQLGINIC